MLCPRCNSENELGEKFCRFCGAPLIDTELFLDPKEQKRRAVSYTHLTLPTT